MYHSIKKNQNCSKKCDVKGKYLRSIMLNVGLCSMLSRPNHAILNHAIKKKHESCPVCPRGGSVYPVEFILNVEAHCKVGKPQLLCAVLRAETTMTKQTDAYDDTYYVLC